MQTAEAVLNIIRERGERGLPIEKVYRQLYNRDCHIAIHNGQYDGPAISK